MNDSSECAAGRGQGRVTARHISQSVADQAPQGWSSRGMERAMRPIALRSSSNWSPSRAAISPALHPPPTRPPTFGAGRHVPGPEPRQSQTASPAWPVGGPRARGSHQDGALAPLEEPCQDRVCVTVGRLEDLDIEHRGSSGRSRFQSRTSGSTSARLPVNRSASSRTRSRPSGAAERRAISCLPSRSPPVS